MRCLTDVRIQAVADREAPPDDVAHVRNCAACAARLHEAERRVRGIEHLLGAPAAIPPALAARVARAVEDGGPPQGATRLRPVAARRWWRPAGWSAAAVAAGTLLLVFVAPAMRGPESVSAASVLAASVTRLAAVPSSGVELREYELVVDGLPRELMPDHPDGAYHIRQALDHGTRGRFRFSSYTEDGRLFTSIAQDPATRTRVSLLRVDDRYYRFEFVTPPSDLPTLPELERLHMEATIRMMQAGGPQQLQEIETPIGRHYLIETPRASATNPDALWDLSRARVLVDAADFAVTEFEAGGTLLNRPYTVSYRLISRRLTASVPPETFTVPQQAGQVVVTGEGTANPALDILVGALRALARQKGAP